MIEINLLPEEYRRKKKADLSQVFIKYKAMILPGAGILGIIIVIISLVILVFPEFQERSLRRLETRWNNLQKDYGKVIRLKNRQKRLKALLDNIEEVTKARILWSRCLNSISDSLPGEIQLTELGTRVEKVKDKPDRTVLVISGIVPSYPGERAIGDFIKALRANPDFMKDFPQIEPPSTQTEPSGFKRFTIKCYLRATSATVDTEKKSKPQTKKDEIA